MASSVLRNSTWNFNLFPCTWMKSYTIEQQNKPIGFNSQPNIINKDVLNYWSNNKEEIVVYDQDSNKTYFSFL